MLEYEDRIKIRDILREIVLNNGYNIDKESNKLLICRPKLIKLLKDNKDYIRYIESFRSELEAIHCIIYNDDSSNHYCKGGCNNLCIFSEENRRYKRSCGSTKCIKNILGSNEAKDKRTKTNIERYGVENVFNVEEFHNKAKETMKTLYGADNPMSSKEIRERQEKAVELLYGVKNVFSNKDIKEKIKKTINSKLGVDYPMQSKIVQEKSIDTCIKKYGVAHAIQNKDIYTKSKLTCIEKYGVDNPSKSIDIQNKLRKIYQSKYGIKNPISSEESIKIIDEINTNLNTNITNFSELYTNDIALSKFIESSFISKNRQLRINEFTNLFNISHSSFKKRIDKLNLLSYFYIKDSKLELKFNDLLLNNNITNYIRRYKKTIQSFEIDFLINNIGIEINDICTHNTKYKDKTYTYHLDKYNYAKDNSIRLIHIWEWELTIPELWNRLSGWILNILNTNKISFDISSCNINLVSLQEEIDFFSNYNLYGYSKSDICIGIYNNKELLQAISLIHDNDNTYTIQSMCTKYNYIEDEIGYIQLLKYLINNYSITSILANCDISKYDESIYNRIGFIHINTIDPQILFYKDNKIEVLSSSRDIKAYANRSVYNCGIKQFKYSI